MGNMTPRGYEEVQPRRAQYPWLRQTPAVGVLARVRAEPRRLVTAIDVKEKKDTKVTVPSTQRREPRS
jgi:hypothetical protein